ncbi:MAG TPA: DUF86 domain-containing protein [Pricia sp.]|nr:DUF86 domain-containing protein [Pricia sp.]
MKNNIGYINDILEQISDIEEFLFEVTEEVFLQSKLRQKAVIRCFEIIGEATKKVNHEFRTKHDGIPWNKMAGFRDVLIHDYDRIESEIVWDTVQKELPRLKSNLLKILEDEAKK